MATDVAIEHRARNSPVGVVRWITTTNHHEIGILYLANSFFFFLLAGILALLMRTELAYPGPTIVDPNTYTELFTMHGTTMVFLVAIPILAGFGNLMVPPLIGAKDMAFPRINALSFWIIPVAGVLMWLGAANIGWTGYAPLSVYDRSIGIDMWIVGLQLLGISSTAGAINFLVTIFRHRAPGITFNNLSLFVWSILVTQSLVLLATPVLAGGLFVLLLDRHGITAFLSPVVGGDPIMWQHLFWFYSHPAVYIMILPAMGIISEVIPRMSHKPIFGYKAIALSTVAIGFLSWGVWVHHMFTTGISMLVSIAAYAWIWGLPFGVGFVILIFVHELGHVIELRRQGVPASAPLFIPFLGAVIGMKQLPDDAWKEARVALAGPILGSVGAVAFWAAGEAAGSELLVGLAFVGFFLNLFNLIPIVPLDGGRAVGALHPAVWLLGLLIMVALLVVSPNPILILIVILGGLELWRRWRERGEKAEYYRLSAGRRLAVAAVYIGLIVALALAVSATYVERDF